MPTGKLHILFFLLASILLLTTCHDLQGNLEETEPGIPSEGAMRASNSGVDSATTTPDQRFDELIEWIETVRGKTVSEIEQMSASQLQAFAEPIIELNENPTVIDELSLMAVREPISEISRRLETISYRQYRVLSQTVLNHIYPSSFTLGRELGEYHKERKFRPDQIRQIVLDIHQNGSTGFTCQSLFNHIDGIVLLLEGDHLNGANLLCPESIIFALMEGQYNRQSVSESKPGNVWIGIGNAVLDGKMSVAKAFENGMNRNSIFGIEIRNYISHGIYSRANTHHLMIRNVDFHSISPDSSGQRFGAIQLDFAQHIVVTDSRFENVASGVRFGHSEGPLKLLRSEGINSGRNFFQCDQCVGPGIRINDNSMRRDWDFGVDPLEDWINLHISSGTPSDYIQVNNNRARGRSSSESGSFILLGDEGGAYQEAIGNQGVNPGEIGIGIAGGQSIRVQGNRMYSHPSEEGNVAFYSIGFTTPCSRHQFSDSNSADSNRANWQRSNGYLNRAWADGKCGISNEEIHSKIVEDTLLTPEIWHDWENKLMDRSYDTTRQTGPDPLALPGLY